MTFWMVCCVEATSTAETWILCPVRIQDRLPSLAEEIVGLKPDVIVAAAVNACSSTRCNLGDPTRHGLGDEGKAVGYLMADGFAVFVA